MSAHASRAGTHADAPATGARTRVLGIRPGGEVASAIRACRGPFAAALACGVGFSLLLLTPTIYMLQLYERVLYSMSPATLLVVSLLATGMMGAMAAFDRARAGRLQAAGARLERSLAAGLFRAARIAGLRGTADRGSARLADLATVQRFVSGPAFANLLDLPWTPVYVGVATLLHPWLGAAAACFVAAQLVLGWVGHRVGAPLARAALDAQRDESAFLQWKLAHAEIVSGLGMVAPLRRRWARRHAHAFDAETTSQATSNRLAAASKALRYAQQSVALGLGGWLTVRGELTAGAMIAATLLVTRALAPVDAVVSVWKDVLSTTGALRRIDDALAADASAAAPSGTRGEGAEARADRIEENGPTLRLVGVEAGLPDGRTVLHALDLELAAGEVVALVGRSGSGKSTLARLVAGVWPDWSGRVSRPPASDGLGYLSQDAVPFDGTVAENVARLGMPRPDAVLAAAQAAGLHEAILRLPKGYDTPLGEGGHPLTAGLRQRVALARAVYGGPSLVVLDEPDAHLDEAGEQALVALLRALRQAGRTVLVVTHRSAVLGAVDRILTLDAGRLVADQRPQPSSAGATLPC
jgi:ATP-binding cassette subfamily C exporter for protease/lipase